MGVGFDDLPIELVEMILRHTTFEEDRVLFRTCRRLYQLLKPNMYRKIELRLDGSTEQALEDSKSRLVQLCRTLYQNNSNVAHLVEEVDIQGTKPLSVLPQLWRQEGSSEWLPRKRRWDGTLRWWRMALGKGNTDVLVAVIVSLVRNVRVLRLGYEMWSDSRFLSHVLDFAKELQTVEFLPPPSRDWDWDAHTDLYKATNANITYDMNQLRALVRLPQVRSITCIIAEPMIPGRAFARLLGNVSCTDMRTLRLVKSELQQRSLGLVLQRMPLLEELVYDHWINVNTPLIMPCYFESRYMDAALARVRGSLRVLHIALTFYSHRGTNIGRGTYWGIINTMQSLARFSNLIELKIPGVLLLGWLAGGSAHVRLASILPASLQRLILRVDEFDGFEYYDWTKKELMERVRQYVNQIVEINEEAGEEIYKLKAIDLELPDLSFQDDAVLRTQLLDDCEAAGIDITIHD